jgi:uncharacterized membrane protein
MAPLIFLLLTFAIAFLINRFLLKDRLTLSFVGRIAMTVMLIVTGIAHFTSSDAMVAMMPDLMPLKRETVYFTGVCELLAATGLLFERFTKLTATVLIIYFLAVLPANILGSFREVNLGGMEYGPWYLLFRVPLQIFFIWWTYYFGIKKA